MIKNALMVLALSVAPLALAACSSSGGDAVTANPNIYPSDYKSEVIATLRPMFNDNETASISGAEISPPALTPVGKDQLYSLCVRYSAHGIDAGNVGTATRRGYFYGGHLNQLVPATDDDCKGVAYQPFAELNRVCLGKGCQDHQKGKSGWGLF